jgi:hypothetical protein
MIGLIMANPLQFKHTDKLQEDEFHYTSKATLILCPSHLCKQWVVEIEKSTKPKLKTFLITTKVQHSKYTYADFAKADVIIVSYQYPY